MLPVESQINTARDDVSQRMQVDVTETESCNAVLACNKQWNDHYCKISVRQRPSIAFNRTL